MDKSHLEPINIDKDWYKKESLAYLQVDTSTTAATDSEIEDFYTKLGYQIKETKITKNNIVIMGDWNSQIRQRERGEKSTISQYTHAGRNDRD